MVLMDGEKARLEGEDYLPEEDAPITWGDDYMQGKEMRSLLYCSASYAVSHWRPSAIQGSICAK